MKIELFKEMIMVRNPHFTTIEAYLFSHYKSCFGIVSDSGEVIEVGFLRYSDAEDRLKELQ